MRLSKTKLAGLIFICAGIGAFGTWVLWLETRTMVPVNIPISMVVGRVRTREFKLNMDAPYGFEIEVQKRIPAETLNCLLGTRVVGSSGTFEDCPDRPPVVKASWLLTSGGRTVAKGSSDDYRSGDWMEDSISRELGHFQSQSGRRYVLDVNVLADGSALALGKPRLKVEAQNQPELSEGYGVVTFIFFFAMVALVLIGGILIFISLSLQRRSPVQSAS
ncbi:MAG: hypothetical protein WBQ86_04700 [Candidatus Binatus sp.]